MPRCKHGAHGPYPWLQEGQRCFNNIVDHFFVYPQLDLRGEAPQAVEQEAGKGTGLMSFRDLTFLLPSSDSAGKGVLRSLPVLLNDALNFGVMGHQLMQGIDHKTASPSLRRETFFVSLLEKLTKCMGDVLGLVEMAYDCNGLAVAVALQCFYKECVLVSISIIKTGPAKTCFIDDVLRGSAIESLAPKQVFRLIEHILFVK